MKITFTLFLSLGIVVLTHAQSPYIIEQMKQANEQQFELNEMRNLLAENQLSTSTPQKLLNFDDADNDGMTDTWETAHGFDPTDPKDAFGDADNDEVLNLFEFQLSADPHSSVTPSKVDVMLTDTLKNIIQSVAPNTVLRLQSGTFLLNYIFFGEKKLMIQGGWNESFSERQPWITPTVLDGQDLDEVIYISASPSNNTPLHSAIVFDGLQIIRGKGTFGNLNLITRKGEYRFSIKDCLIANTEDSVTFKGLNIHHWDSTSLADVTIVNTAIVSNPNASGIYSQNTEGSKVRWRIINCTISNNKSQNANDAGHGYNGFTLDEPTQKNIKVINSIISGNDKIDIKFHRHIVIDASYSNIDSINSAPYTPASGSIYNAGPGMINQDAMFADSSALNYYLLQGSPCLDSGIDVGLPYLGTAPDMGAFEGFGTTAVLAIGAGTAVQVYPNPASSYVTFDCSALFSTGKESPVLRIFNLYGQEVLNTPIQQNFHIIDCNAFLPGAYFYQVLSEKSTISAGKLDIVH